MTKKYPYLRKCAHCNRNVDIRFVEEFFSFGESYYCNDPSDRRGCWSAYASAVGVEVQLS